MLSHFFPFVIMWHTIGMIERRWTRWLLVFCCFCSLVLGGECDKSQAPLHKHRGGCLVLWHTTKGGACAREEGVWAVIFLYFSVFSPLCFKFRPEFNAPNFLHHASSPKNISPNIFWVVCNCRNQVSSWWHIFFQFSCHYAMKKIRLSWTAVIRIPRAKSKVCQESISQHSLIVFPSAELFFCCCYYNLIFFLDLFWRNPRSLPLADTHLAEEITALPRNWNHRHPILHKYICMISPQTGCFFPVSKRQVPTQERGEDCPHTSGDECSNTGIVWDYAGMYVQKWWPKNTFVVFLCVISIFLFFLFHMVRK